MIEPIDDYTNTKEGEYLEDGNDSDIQIDNVLSLDAYNLGIEKLLAEFPKEVINEIYAEETGYSCVPVDILTFIDQIKL